MLTSLDTVFSALPDFNEASSNGMALGSIRNVSRVATDVPLLHVDAVEASEHHELFNFGAALSEAECDFSGKLDRFIQNTIESTAEETRGLFAAEESKEEAEIAANAGHKFEAIEVAASELSSLLFSTLPPSHAFHLRTGRKRWHMCFAHYLEQVDCGDEPVQRILMILRAIVAAAATLHSRFQVHGSLRAENIFLVSNLRKDLVSAT
jgi:hypothetical protein